MYAYLWDASLSKNYDICNSDNSLELQICYPFEPDFIYLSLLPDPGKGEEGKHILFGVFLWNKRRSSSTSMHFFPAPDISPKATTVEVHLSGCQPDTFHGHLASGEHTQDRPHLGTDVKQGHCKGLSLLCVGTKVSEFLISLTQCFTILFLLLFLFVC